MITYIKQSTTFQGHHLDCGHDVIVIEKGKKTSTVEAETFGKILTGELENKFLKF